MASSASYTRHSLTDVRAGYDVVVIGAGAAGMSAALFSSIRGASTLLVEKTGFVGGTSALSAGSIWIPNTRHAAEVAAFDSACASLSATRTVTDADVSSWASASSRRCKPRGRSDHDDKREG